MSHRPPRFPILGILLLLLAVAAPRAHAQAGEGPIQPGDRVLLRVAGEPRLNDTFTVSAGPMLMLPVVGAVSLAGVPRDSLASHLTAFLAAFLNRPAVQAQVLLRLGVIGEVARPGFYALPTDAVVEDLIMAAGGMTVEARFDRAALVRAEDVLFRGESLRRAMAEGRTFDDLALRSGDALRIPRRPDQESRVRIITGLITIPLAVYGITRIF